MSGPRLSLATRIIGPRVLLRPVREADAAEVAALRRRNKAHLAPWNPLPPPGEDPASLTVVSRSIVVQRAHWREGKSYPLAVVLRRPGRHIIGQVTFNAVVRGVFQNAYLGYWIDHEHQGQGLMTEAVDLALSFAFTDAELHRVQAAIMPRNEASLRVAEKLGFRREGFALRYLKIAGSWEDHALFALTREERGAPSDFAQPGKTTRR